MFLLMSACTCLMESRVEGSYRGERGGRGRESGGGEEEGRLRGGRGRESGGGEEGREREGGGGGVEYMYSGTLDSLQ